MMWLAIALLGCKGPEDTAPGDTGALEKCELDLDSPWSFGKVHLPFEAMIPGVAAIADRLILAGGYYDDRMVEEVYVGTTDDSGLLGGWEILAELPEEAEPFQGHTLPSSPDRLVLFGGLTSTSSREEILWAKFDGITLGEWKTIDSIPETVFDARGLFTTDDQLLILGGKIPKTGEYGGCWTTTFTEDGPSSWEPIPCMGDFDSPRVAATGRNIHVAGSFMDDGLYVNGFASARLVDGIPQEWERGRSPASTSMGDLTVAEGYLFTGPAHYKTGGHVASAVLYSDANAPLGWQYLPDLPLEIGNGTMVAHDGFLYVMGGTDLSGNRMDQIFSRPICIDADEG